VSRIRLLGSTRNETTVALAAAWHADVVGPADVAEAEPGDVTVARLDVLPTLDGVEPGLLGLLLLERRGACVVNPAPGLLATHDKLRTARLLASAGLPHPRFEHVRSGLPVVVRPPLVVKPRFGSWGRDVFRCDDDRAVAACFAALQERPWFRRQGALVQELLPPLGHDLRMVVVGGRVVGAAERVAAPGEWRTNISLGGSARTVVPDDEACALARAAVAVCGADFVGVDLAPLADGRHVVLELNGAVEFDETYALGGRSVYAEALRMVDSAFAAPAGA
jgi:RimK family alpha-L-glutamate ligase